MKHRLIIGIALLAALLLALTSFALAQDEAVSMTANVESIQLNVGENKDVKLTITPKTAQKAGYTCVSSDEGVATVNSRARVHGVAAGSCEITFISNADNSVKLVVPVTVIVPVKRMKLEVSAASIHIGETASITCIYTPENATLQSATFTSSKDAIATVDENGVVTGVSKGDVTITAHSADGKAKATVKVRVLQQPTEITLSAAEDVVIDVGKNTTLRATVLPKNANNKNVVWSSSDESVATVNKSGRVTAVSLGTAVITAACEDAPAVTASVKVVTVQPVKSVAFNAKDFYVTINEQLSLSDSFTVSPENASNKNVTYKVDNAKIAAVDENGVVTGLKGGKTTVHITTADGSRRRASATLHVIVPVTGVSLNKAVTRVGVQCHTFVKAEILPKDATNRNMIWVSSDPSIAEVKGSKNEARIIGHAWGRCVITGTTEDGGYTCSVTVNVGSLRRAVVVSSIEIKNGKPSIVLKNKSNMNITNVYYSINGTNEFMVPVQLSRSSNTLTGSYDYALAPGEKTTHGRFTFHHAISYSHLEYVAIAITGWDTDTGYYDNNDNILYSYRISSGQLDWVDYETDLFKRTQDSDMYLKQ